MFAKLKILRWLGIICLTFIFVVTGQAQQGNTGFLGFGPNSCVLNYVTGPTEIQRFNICTGQALPDLTLNRLPDPHGIQAIQSLPDGGVLVSNVSVIARYDRNGTMIRIYDKAGEDCWSGLALEPDGSAFWAASSCHTDVTRFVLTLDPHMFGGGSEVSTTGIQANFGMDLHCDASIQPNYLQVVWGNGTSNTFYLTNLTSASCSGSPFNTQSGSGTGTLNGQAGASARWTLVDNGQPGINNDSAQIVIKDASGETILTLTGKLLLGSLIAN